MPTNLTGFQSPYDPFGFGPNAGAGSAIPMLDVGNTNLNIPTYSTGTGQTGAPSIWDSAFSKRSVDGSETQGWATPALGAASGLFNAFLGIKQYGLAKDQLSEGKRQFGLNYDAQRSTTNAQLQDRQAARVASNPGAYQSVGDYMNQYGIKPATGG